jgi:uncharacterized protein (DUF169 family)
MTTHDWPALARALSNALNLTSPPLSITFSDEVPVGVERFSTPMPPPLADGRTGRVPAGCVFWTKATDRTFATIAEDHGNCSVGSVTHGFKTLDEVAGNSDVAALLDAGWVTMDVVPRIPVVATKPGAVTYGPLEDALIEPDVVLLRVNAKQLMVLHDAIPAIRIEGKPQCHIIAIAKEYNEAAASVGCALSRVRTGMSANEMTCALPAQQLPEIVATIERNAAADTTVARYAAQDALRFA